MIHWKYNKNKNKNTIMTTNKSNNPEELFDILAAIEVPDKKIQENIIKNTKDKEIDDEHSTNKQAPMNSEQNQIDWTTIAQWDSDEVGSLSMNTTVETRLSESDKKIAQKEVKPSMLSNWIFALRYVLTSVFIFSVLLLTTNYSAYLDIAKSYIFEDEINRQTETLLNSVSAWEINAEEQPIKEEVIKKTKQQRKTELKKQEEKSDIKEDKYAIKRLVAHMNKEEIDLSVSLVPYENRIVIPKIGKNIPLIDVQETQVEGKKQLDNIFMKELEEWVVRYPGSAIPWEKWNAFVFGHSSNFPWIAWEYNDVFSRLWQVEEWDIVFSYYWQKKYTYKIIEKAVIKPTEVDILKRNKDVSELTLMTCWPIGTTLNRLILIGELIEE